MVASVNLTAIKVTVNKYAPCRDCGVFDRRSSLLKSHSDALRISFGTDYKDIVESGHDMITTMQRRFYPFEAYSVKTGPEGRTPSGDDHGPVQGELQGGAAALSGHVEVYWDGDWVVVTEHNWAAVKHYLQEVRAGRKWKIAVWYSTAPPPVAGGMALSTSEKGQEGVSLAPPPYKDPKEYICKDCKKNSGSASAGGS